MARALAVAVFVLICCANAATRPSQAVAAGDTPHLHHIQLRVSDPAAAMQAYVKANACVEAILQGLGVGVRCGRTYLLFERNTELPAAGATRGRVTVIGRGDAAEVKAVVASPDGPALATWLKNVAGVTVSAALTFVPSERGGTLPDEIAHIGIGLGDPAPLIARMHTAATRVVSATADETMFLAPGRVAVSIVRDRGFGPDAYWCLMHPDVRSPTPGKCPICGMTMVPIPVPVFGDDRMEVSYAATGMNRGHLTIRILDKHSGAPVKSFAMVHDKPFHLFIVSRDLKYFSHIHPAVAEDGTLGLDVTLPGPGMYMAYGDFYPDGGTPQLLQAPLVTPGYRGSPFPDPESVAPAPASATDLVDGLRVTLSHPDLVAGRDTALTFDLQRSDGTPVTDLQPYLAAAGHLFMVSADLIDADHSHPSDFAAKGPRLTFQIRPAHPGLYKVWVQFQRAGKVTTAGFTMNAH
jgi:hypothetical protein